MEKNQVLEVCQEYDEILAKDGFEIKHRDTTSSRYDMNHIRYMVNEIPKIIDQPCKKEKAMRWLGFVQGVLWLKGYYTIDEMKGHTKSGKECKEEIKPVQGETYYWFDGGYMMYGD